MNEARIRVSALNRERPTLAHRFGDDVHNVLLLAPPMGASADDGCTDLLSVDPPSREDVLVVTFVDSPDERLAVWRSRAGDEVPARLGFVAVDGSTRSAASTTAAHGGAAVERSIATVSGAATLTDVGIEVSRYLLEWEGDGNRTVVCFHSLSALLQQVDVERAFRFLHVLTGRVRATEGFAHYHLDPTAHDARTVNTLKTLFDGVAELDGTACRARNP